MPTHLALQELFTAAGEALGEVNVLEYAEREEFLVEFEGFVVILIAHDPERGVLVFESDLGSAPEGSEPRLFPVMLTVNRIWDQTGGLRLSVEGEDTAVTLLLDLGTGELTADRLATALRSFAERVLLWREIVRNGAEGLGQDQDQDKGQGHAVVPGAGAILA